MKPKFIICITLLCVLAVLMAAGCSAVHETAQVQDAEPQDAAAPESEGQPDTQDEAAPADKTANADAAQSEEEPVLQTVLIQQALADSIEVEHIILLNSFLEEDMQIIKEMNIPPEEYQLGGYYRRESGEFYTYPVDPNTPVTIYDISQEYGAGEDRMFTFATYQDFLDAVAEHEGLLIAPYILTIQDGVVVKIAEKFYN